MYDISENSSNFYLVTFFFAIENNKLLKFGIRDNDRPTSIPLYSISETKFSLTILRLGKKSIVYPYKSPTLPKITQT